MTIRSLGRFRIALNIALLTDLQRAGILAGINKVAPQSPLMQVPSVAASVNALTAKGATLAADVQTAAAAEKVYRAAVGALNGSRNAYDKELDGLKGLVENNATSEADVTGMGFSLLVLAKPSRAQPDAPGALVTKTGRVHGKARVAVDGKGYLGSFVAQVATDAVLSPQTVWTELPGRGKERKLSGPTGTKLWVRMAAIRYGLQSDWSVAVLVTLP
jgi:hypothetical protein